MKLSHNLKVIIEKDGQTAEAVVTESQPLSTLEYTLYTLNNGSGLEWERDTNSWRLLPNMDCHKMIPVNVRFS